MRSSHCLESVGRILLGFRPDFLVMGCMSRWICIIGVYHVQFPVGYENWRIARCNRLSSCCCDFTDAMATSLTSFLGRIILVVDYEGQERATRLQF